VSARFMICLLDTTADPGATREDGRRQHCSRSFQQGLHAGRLSTVRGARPALSTPAIRLHWNCQIPGGGPRGSTSLQRQAGMSERTRGETIRAEAR